MALPVTLKDITFNLREITPDMGEQEKIDIINENVKITLEIFKILQDNIKEVNENG